ncbi:trypsin inhibitor DE5 alpha chain-like [Neltuma alba]|uniref:trypsin inhibitor DE5 alpha chain-like n=1 Tax=Neltuma alba TaxID=207710 RepID=UPI0010A4AF52|nr:trypsin inhibitor DE5 alpha chain-like [Prosopis alba]
MKVNLLALFFLLFAFISAKAGPLVDTEDSPIRNGGSYYILPALRGLGGGVSLAATGNETCPLTVVQTINELSNGLPTRLSSPHRIAYLRTDFNLEFTVVAPPKCAAQPAKWTIVGGDDEIKQVKLAGYEDTLRGSFRIQTYRGLTYRIVFCSTDEDSCSALGISKDDKGHKIFVINDDDPFIVVFGKAESSAE